MKPEVLTEPIRAYRIGDPDGLFPVWSAEGAKQVQGRWHAAGQGVIYASEHYSTALLEKLAQCNGVLPPNQHFVEATIPQGVSYEVVSQDSLPGWSDSSGASARDFGNQWYRGLRSAILIVPSVVARLEQNIVINATHPEFERRRITVGLETPVWWDQRLFVNPASEPEAH